MAGRQIERWLGKQTAILNDRQALRLVRQTDRKTEREEDWKTGTQPIPSVRQRARQTVSAGTVDSMQFIVILCSV